MELDEEEKAELAMMGVPSGTSSTTVRPCTPSGQGKASVEVLKASIFNVISPGDNGPRRS